MLHVRRVSGEDPGEFACRVLAGVRGLVLGQQSTLPWPLSGWSEQRPQRAPVHRPAGPAGRARLPMGEAEDRRREIDVRDRLGHVSHGARAVQISPRRADHER